MARHKPSSNDKISRHGKKREKFTPKRQQETPAPSNDNDLTVQEKCDLIAQLSESVLEDPSTAFFSIQEHDDEIKTPSKIRQLLLLAKPNEQEEEDDYVARLACMSLLALFQDILPSYRIRLPTAAEMAVRVSKETKKMWDYERALLSHYQQYLKLLEQTWNKRKLSNIPSALAMTAMLSLCELCKSAFAFNFGSNVLALVVRQMNNGGCDEISEAACQAISFVFRTDVQGDLALEAARLVAKMMKDVHYRVKPQVLQTFAALPLRVHLDEAQAAKLAAAANAKKRKRNKQEAEIESELKEGSSSVDKILLARSQSDTLECVTLAYFNILKSSKLNSDYIGKLLPPALEGLAKFAHLINFETVVDLLGVFKTLLKRVDELPLDASLNCILTAFQTLQGPGRELKIDQKEYITPLYSQLPRLVTEGKHTELALQCLNAAFIKRREYSTVRIAAFVKQLCTVALHAPPHTAAPLLAFCRQLSQRYPSVHQMMENEQDVITSGTYNPNVEDPEHSNPFATSAWELATLKFHVHPQVSHHAVGASSLKMLQLPFEAPERVRKEMKRDSNEFYIHSRRAAPSKKHPLAGKGHGSSNKRQRQERFITANKTGNYHFKSY